MLIEGLEGALLREEGEGIPDFGGCRVGVFFGGAFCSLGRFCLSVGGGVDCVVLLWWWWESGEVAPLSWKILKGRRGEEIK